MTTRVNRQSSGGFRTTKRVTPKQTLHEYCHYCIRDRRDSEVEQCGGGLVIVTGRPCPFYLYHMGKRRPPMKVFRQFCLECMGGSAQFVRECGSTNCPLHPYRFGKNPSREGVGGGRKKGFGMGQSNVPKTPLSGGYGA